MPDRVVFIVILVSLILLPAGSAFYYFRLYRKILSENKQVIRKIEVRDKHVEQQVKERTMHLENIRDSISGYAVQKFELAQELEIKNRELLEQKDFNAKQTEILRIAYEEIQKLHAYQQQMVRMMIHDLKNPLNVILNLTDSENFPSKPGKLIRQISFEMLDLIINMLEVHKFESQAMRIDFENINLGTLVNKSVEKFSPLLAGSSINLATDISSSCWINADRHIVNRILVNILSNAVKYTSSGGSIQLTAGRKDEMVLISIKDNGNGIPKEHIENLFKMGNQGVRKETLYNSSTGIGLAYCKLAAVAMGGEIGIDSEEGKGTNVWFTLNAGNGILSSDKQPGGENQNVKTPELILSVHDREFLEPFVLDLQSANICEVTRILSLIGKIDCPDNIMITRWKDLVEETLFSANEKRFKELIYIL